MEIRTLSSILLLIHADVIDIVALRKNAVINTLCAAPIAADCEVEDKVLRIVVRPGFGSGPFILIGEILLIIDVKIQLGLVPLQRVQVERLGGIRDCYLD